MCVSFFVCFVFIGCVGAMFYPGSVILCVHFGYQQKEFEVLFLCMYSTTLQLCCRYLRHRKEFHNQFHNAVKAV